MACGLLAGVNGEVSRVFPISNELNSRNQFYMVPEEQYDAMVEIEKIGLTHLGMYYSQESGRAYPSKATVDMWSYPEAACLIVSLAKQDDPEIGVFKIEDNKSVTRLDLQVLGVGNDKGQTDLYIKDEDENTISNTISHPPKNPEPTGQLTLPLPDRDPHWKNDNGRRIDTSDWPYLDEITKPDLYIKNVFRISGLDVTASLKQAKKLLRQSEQRRKLGIPVQSNIECILLLDDPPSDEDVKHAIDQKLGNPHRRLIEELFWFWPLHSNSTMEADSALSLLKIGKVDEAKEIWVSQYDSNPIALHNIGVFYHLKSLDLEYNMMVASLSLSKELQLQLSALWKSAYDCWSKLILDSRFWDLLIGRAHQIDKTLDSDKIDAIRRGLPCALLSINTQLLIEYGLKNDFINAGRQTLIISESVFDMSYQTEALKNALKPLSDQVHAFCSLATRKMKHHPEQGGQIAKNLLDKTEILLRCIRTLSSSGSGTSGAAHDAVAETALEALTAYGMKTEDWELVLERNREIAHLAYSKTVKDYIQNSHKYVLSKIVERRVGPIEKMCEGISQSSDGPEAKYNHFKSGVLPKLKRLGQSIGTDSESYRLAANICAICLRSISVDLHNISEDYSQSVKAIKEALELCSDASVRKDLEAGLRLCKAHLRQARKQKSKPVQALATIIGFIIIIWIIESLISSPDSNKAPGKSSSSYRSSYTSSSSKSSTRSTLKYQIEEGKKQIRLLESRMTNINSRLEDYEQRMRQYSQLEMVREYNALVPVFNSLALERGTIYKQYEQLLQEVNAKINRYNRDY